MLFRSYKTAPPPPVASLVAQGELRDAMTYNSLDRSRRERAVGALTAKVSTQHQIQDEEAILIILERVSQIHYERVVDLSSQIQ